MKCLKCNNGKYITRETIAPKSKRVVIITECDNCKDWKNIEYKNK